MKKSEQAHIPHHPTLPDNTTQIKLMAEFVLHVPVHMQHYFIKNITLEFSANMHFCVNNYKVT